MGAEGVGLANSVDDFAQQVGVGELFDAFVGVTLTIVALEALDFRAEYFLEAFVDLARVLKGIAINKQRRRR